MPSYSLLHFSAVLFRWDLWSNRSSQFHKESPIVFHLQPVTSCAHCGLVLLGSMKKHYRFYLWQCFYYCLWVICVLALWVTIFFLKSGWLCSEPCFHVPIFGVFWAVLKCISMVMFSPQNPISFRQRVFQALDITHFGSEGAQRPPQRPKSPTATPISINTVTVATKRFKSRHKRWGFSGVVIQWGVKEKRHLV